MLDYEQSLFFLSPLSKTCETCKWPCVWLLLDTLTHACIPLYKIIWRKRETAHSLTEFSHELEYVKFLSADCLIFLIQFVTVSVLIVLRLRRLNKIPKVIFWFKQTNKANQTNSQTKGLHPQNKSLHLELHRYF